jgi:hypothetical protein
MAEGKDIIGEGTKLNIYQCQVCRGMICTVDRDEGVTPFGIDCKAKSGCAGPMLSSFYRVWPRTIPTWEWYRPASTEGMKPAVKEHVSKGGLLLRPIQTPAQSQSISDAAKRAALSARGSSTSSDSPISDKGETER